MNNLDIKKIRRKLNVSQAELAAKIGVSPRTIQNWEKGTTIPEPKYAILTKLLDEDFVDTQEARNLIPLYDDISSIGSKENNEEDSKPEYIDTGDWFKSATAAVKNYGDSMIEYPDGCILAIKEVYDRDLLVPGKDYVIETSEYRVTKRVQTSNKDGYITAYSTNPETYNDGHLVHEPFDIKKSAIQRIYLVLGYVVKKSGGTLIFKSNEEKL